VLLRFQQLIESFAIRLRTGSPLKLALVEAALRHFQEVTYSRIRNAGFSPGTIIDIGAYVGDWTKLVKGIFPHASVFMIEGRDELESNLRLVSSQYCDVEYRIALLGAAEQEKVPFHVGGTGSSIYRERSDTTMATISTSMTTLDKIVPSALRSPIFLKLDVQGAELDVLRGADRTLENTEVVQLETALLSYNEGAPTSAEVIAFMDKCGFAMFDIAGFIRPNGKDLVQIDIIFVRKESKLRSDRLYFGRPAQ
jgi:FkbM family methyltransferase